MAGDGLEVCIRTEKLCTDVEKNLGDDDWDHRDILFILEDIPDISSPAVSSG